MTDACFDEYCSEVIVHKRYLTPEQQHVYETEEAKLVEPWDPMGSF